MTAGSQNTSIFYVGGGGGGGMQFGDGALCDGQPINGLGLGAGTGTQYTNSLPFANPAVQYSYSTGGLNGQTVNTYTQSTIDQYNSMFTQLNAYLQSHATAIVLTGGGGMGGGMEYLKDAAGDEELTPHAISTQSGFSFTYTFTTTGFSSIKNTPPLTDDPLTNFLQNSGQVYADASNYAIEPTVCPKGYNDYTCVCQQSAIYVANIAITKYGVPAATLPPWVGGVQYCSTSSGAAQPGSSPENGLTNYQQEMVNRAIAANANNSAASSVTINQQALVQYFQALNTPDPKAVDICVTSS